MKGPDRSHFIQRFKFDFEIERREDANRLQNTLSRLFNDRIKPLLDRLMTKYDDPAFVTRIPMIELDLGVLLDDHYENELIIRLEQQFSRELALRMAELKHATAIISPEKGQRTALVPAQIEVLSHYLAQGRLPVGAESMSGKIEQLFWSLLDEQPRNVMTMLKTMIIRSPKALRRLANSFSEKLIERIYGLAIDQNSLSIITYEKQLASQVAKATEKPLANVEAELRVILLRYLIAERPASFQLALMKDVVAERLGKIFGAPAAKAVKQDDPKTAAEDPLTKREVMEKGRIREAAVSLISAVIQGKAGSETQLAILEAWEFLVANDLPALQNVLATQAKTPEALTELVEIIPPAALRNFVQKLSTTIGLRLIQVAATVVSAHDLFAPTAATHARITQAIYATLLHEVTSHPSASPRPEVLLKAIQAHLTTMVAPPAELITHWEDFDFVGPAPLEKPAPRTEDADAEPQTPEQKAEAQRKIEEELKKLADEERRKGPMTPEERRAAAEKSRLEREQAKLRAEAWEDEQAANIERARKGDRPEGDDLESDEEFFKRGRERLRQASQSQRLELIEDLSQLDPNTDIFSTPILDTVEGRADVVMHFLATGAAPWWAQRFIPMQVEMMVKSLIQRDPAALTAAFIRTARSIPTDRYPTFVSRILELLNESTFMAFMPLIAGELGGFTMSIGLALQAGIADLPTGNVAPSTEREKRTFAYAPQIRYLVEYASSDTAPGQMLRFVLKQKQIELGLTPRTAIEWFAEVLEALIAKGERRFNPLKTMLPKVFEGIEVAPPRAHDRGLDAIAFERALTERKQVPGTAAVPQDTAGNDSVENVVGADSSFTQGDTPETRQGNASKGEPQSPENMDGTDSVPNNRVEAGSEPSERPEIGEEGKTPEGKDPQIDTADPVHFPKHPDSPDTQGAVDGPQSGELTPRVDTPELPDQPELGRKPEEGGPEPVDASTDPEGEEDEANLTPEQKEKRAKAREWQKRMQAAFYPEQQPEESTESKVLELQPEEVEAFKIDEAWVVETIRYFLVHGSLSPAATAMYTRETFREEIKIALASGTRPVIQMLREIIGNRDVRQRLFGMGEEVIMLVINLVNVAASDKMVPYVREMVNIFRSNSAPITATYVYEHAIQHALTLRTTFLPITYMKEFFEFLAMQPSVNVKEAIVWANRRLETSSSPLKSSLDEMLDVVDRIEQIREDRRQQSPEDGRRSAPTYIPSAMDEEIYVSNAGVGIMYLFVIQLFKAFKMITDDKKEFVSQQAKVRGIHQIQYLCYKEVDTPEENMVLAKLLVGWPLDEPLEPLETPLNEDDIDTCEAIMGMVCSQWGVMKNAGADYVRKTFIQREGKLKQEGSDWLLKVEQNGIDVLKNKIPWSTNPIRLPWLDYLIEVEWP